jgi:two-component system, sensor histidine kinase and response regulator
MLSAPKILVVDDNAENRALALAALEDEDYQVVLAAGGEEGVRAFEQERPDCILLDVRMPGMDGFAVCSAIRALEGGADTPILFLTALRDLETFDRALLAGCDDFLTKPVRPAELISRVQSALKLRRVSAELREHYELVRKQRDALIRLQLQKERLSAFVVHDLKNPVSSIDLAAQLLARDVSLPAHARQSAEQIRSATRTLLRLILNLLDISKSEEGKLSVELSTVDLDALSRELVEANAANAEERRVALATRIDAKVVRADVDLLRRVLENLLDNALRHAPARTGVSVSTTQTDAGIEIRVNDEGAGIPAALRDQIFDPFVQAPSGDRPVTRTGRGLGLAFCKLAIEAHGGTIHVEGTATGATICVRLPHEQ